MKNKTKIIIGSIISVFVLCIMLYTRLHYKNDYLAQVISDDLQKLTAVFAKINKDCGIAEIDHIKISINFLNTISFVGSDVGCLSLIHPEKWQGPYLKENPTINGIEYQLIRVKDGYFIIPGDGVRLPNGNIIGKDIIITKNTEIIPLIEEKKTFCYKQWCTVGHLDFGSNILHDLTEISELE